MEIGLVTNEEYQAPLRRASSLTKLYNGDTEEQKNHGKTKHRYHSPQMQRKTYIKPPKPKKPHGLKLEIPERKAKQPIDSGIHTWSGSSSRSRSGTASSTPAFGSPSTATTPLSLPSGTPSTPGNDLATPATATTPLPLSSGTPTAAPRLIPGNKDAAGHSEKKKAERASPVPARRILGGKEEANLRRSLENLDSPTLREKENGDILMPLKEERQKQAFKTVLNDTINHNSGLSPGRERVKEKLEKSRSLDDSVLLDRSPSRGDHSEPQDEPLTPKRKAPRPPHARHIRRKSDTVIHVVKRQNSTVSANSRQRRVTTENGFSYHVKLEDIKSDYLRPGNEDPARTGKHRYYTPQPARKAHSFSAADILNEAGHYGVSPIERKVMGQKHKNAHAGNITPNTSPERNKRTSIPISPLASPVKIQLVQRSGGGTILTPPPLKTHHGNESDNSSDAIQEDDDDDLVLEISDSSSYDGFVMVSKKPTKRAKHRSLPAQIAQRGRTSSHGSQDALGVQHSKTTKVTRRKARGHSAPLERMKSSSKTRSRMAPIPASRTSPERKRGDGLRESLLRQRQLSRTSLQNSPTLQPNPPVFASNHNNQAHHHKPHIDQDETDFASKDDFVDSVSGYNPHSPGASPTRRPRRGSLSSQFSLYSTASIFKEIFMSERSSHRKIKAVVGFVFGLILGIILYMVLDFALEYQWEHALIITSVATLFMALSLALTVRARCVAALMIPTLCTSKGRGAIYAIIIGLLLSGPIQNIYLNAEETSNSMACSSEMAVNHSRQIQEASQQVLDSYVGALVRSIHRLEVATQTVNEVFQPIEEGLEVLQDGLLEVTEVLQEAAATCDDILTSAANDCKAHLRRAYQDCKTAFGGNVRKRSITLGDYPVHSRTKRQGISKVCRVLDLAEACKFLELGGLCQIPATIDNFVDDTVGDMLVRLEELHNMLMIDVNFDTYFDTRQAINGSVRAIQAAVQEELQETHDIIKQVFSISDKILALSLLWLAFRSYNYYWKFCTKDKFDNFYITDAYKKMDEHRKSEGKQHLLPLKKTEKRNYVDLASFRLCKPERGLFKIGLAMVFMHATIALIVIAVDYGLFWLLAIIRKHGEFQYSFESEGQTDLDIGGSGFMSQFVRWMFVEGFNATNTFNLTIDTTVCLPQPTVPKRNTAIAIGVLYVFTLLTVLCQAYMLRLRRFIASYYYPEREIERTLYLYNDTLNRRNNLFRLLRRYMKQRMKETENNKQISINAYLMRRYRWWGAVMRALGIYNKHCQGCQEKDKHRNFKRCSDRACDCIYCPECAREAGSICACNEFLEDYIHGTSQSKS